MSIVSTIEGYCKSCFSCVRNCPVKAIKVENGQAKVVPELCISCGHCVKVCSQGAKKIATQLPQVLDWLQSNERVIACLAPSFVVEFFEHEAGQVASALKSAGFWQVHEVAFGADLVTQQYRRLLEEGGFADGLISTACPAVVNMVEKHYPRLIPKLVPVVSPMIALGRYLKGKYQNGVKVVFIGPCIAKKDEIRNRYVQGAVDAVLTFDELRALLKEYKVDIAKERDCRFDNPPVSWGRIFPLSGGLLKSASMDQDILQTEVISIEGKDNCLNILGALEKGEKSVFIDALFCEGCINGPMMTSDDLDLLQKRAKIIGYFKNNNRLGKSMTHLPEVELGRRFSDQGWSFPVPSEKEINDILAELGKYTPEDQLNCGACGYLSCRDKAVAVYRGLAENKMCLPYLVKQLEEYNTRLRQQLKDRGGIHELLGNSHAIQEIRALIGKVAPTDCTVLIQGESGTGKDVVAQAIFHHSLRSEQAFVAINCAALPESLLESELFGYAKGAFTGAVQAKKGLFEEAHLGTIFLDEIGDLSIGLQAKLLRVLQQGEFFRIGDTRPRKVDVRVIAATNQPLEEMVKRKLFRADLFYRLNVVTIRIPPLRERKDDIPVLAKHFLSKFNRRHGRDCAGFEPQAMEMLKNAPWPGNVRQLENTVERAVILCDGEKIKVKDLQPGLQEQVEVEQAASTFSYKEAVKEYQRKLIIKALERNDWVQARAAETLGMNRSTLNELIKRLGIDY